MTTTYKLSVHFADGCKSWYYFDNERQMRRKAKRLAKYHKTEKLELEITQR